MLKQTNINTTSRILLISMSILIIGLMLSEFVYRIEVQREVAAAQNRVLSKAISIRAQLESELNSSIHLAVGLSGFLSLDPDMDEESMTTLLSTVFKHGRNLRNIGIAPDNRITHVYPIEGNEAAVGLVYESVPKQWETVQRVMESKQTILDGPVNLVQGGRAIIARTPVYLPDGEYWGIVSIVVNLDDVIADVTDKTADLSIAWALRSKRPVQSDEDIIHGFPALFINPVLRQNVEVPGDTWELVAGLNTDNNRHYPYGPARDHHGQVSSIIRTSSVVVKNDFAIFTHL